MVSRPPPTHSVDQARNGAAEGVIRPARGEVIRLHIGGTQVRAGWRIFNVQPGPGVDYVGDCRDLSRFADNSVEEIYASHVYEHLSYQGPLQAALAEAYRVLRPGGLFRAGVPDLEQLCRLFLDQSLTFEQRFFVQRMIYGGQVDDSDYHRAGFDFQTIGAFLHQVGFKNIRRVANFGLFDDMAEHQFGSVAISLNVMATK